MAESRKMPSVLVTFLFVCCCCCATMASVITMDGNGYKGVLVAINNAVPEDEDLLTNIKELFTNASSFLYTATRGQAFFKEITIAIPATWTPKPNYERVFGNYFSNSHFRIDEPNLEYGDAPYTLQPGGCGEPGQYVHFTPWFIKELRRETMETYGKPERQLVHEWAHLRYGVFDEYGDSDDRRYPMFYQENGRMRPTNCIRDIRGWIESKDGGPCKIVEGGFVSNDCMFIPDMRSEEAKASIMYMPFIPAMEGFCDDDESSEQLHNNRAPTKQNNLCNYESTWSIISKHPDFANKRAKRQADDFLDPIFRLVQPPLSEEGRYVLVLDVSGSMNGRPISLLHRAATRLVQDRIPDGAYLGIVQFSTRAKILHGLTKVSNLTRTKLSKTLPSKDDGGTTAIGRGLQAGLKVLTENNSPSEGGLILLITDGEENVAPFIDEVFPDLLKAKVIVNTVAFGRDASEKLENVTVATGGKGYFFSNINGSRPASALDSAFLESVTSQADIQFQPVQIKNEMFNLYEDQTDKTVYIDSDLGKNTVFTFTSPDIHRVYVTIRSPSGRRYNQNSPEYSMDTESRQRIQIKLPESETGLWTLTIHKEGYYPVVVAFSLISEPKDARYQPIRLRSWLNDMQMKFPAYAKVYAEVKKGYMPVLGARVMATVDRPMGRTVDVELRDDGIGADVTKDDGIYTGYFTHFNGNGRYAVVARVINDGNAQVKPGTKSSGAIAQPKPLYPETLTKEPAESFPSEDFVIAKTNYSEVQNDTRQPIEKFERSYDSGAFRLENWAENAGDIIPPGNISDLIVLEAIESDEAREVTLQWTTTGNDLYSGNASALQLRASTNADELIHRFHDAFLFNDSLISEGTLKPFPPGSLQTVRVAIPMYVYDDSDRTATLYFGIKALDDSNNTSPGHNIAAANFGNFGITWDVVQKQRNTLKWWPIALSIGCIVFFLAIGILVAWLVVRRRKEVYKAVCSELK